MQLIKNGQYEFAEQFYKKQLDGSLQLPSDQYGLALAYYMRKNYAEAVRYCDMILEKPNSMHQRAYSLKISSLNMTEQYADAIKIADEAIKKYPDNHLLWCDKGVAQLAAGNYKKAVDAFMESIYINADYVESHMYLGMTLGMMGRTSDMLMCYYYYLYMRPESKTGKTIYESMLASLAESVKKGRDGKPVFKAEKSNKENEKDKKKERSPESSVKETENMGSDERFEYYTAAFLEHAAARNPVGKYESFAGLANSVYIPMYRNIKLAGFTDVFPRYVTAGVDPSAKVWLAENRSRTDEFEIWLNSMNLQLDTTDTDIDHIINDLKSVGVSVR